MKKNKKEKLEQNQTMGEVVGLFGEKEYDIKDDDAKLLIEKDDEIKNLFTTLGTIYYEYQFTMNSLNLRITEASEEYRKMVENIKKKYGIPNSERILRIDLDKKKLICKRFLDNNSENKNSVN